MYKRQTLCFATLTSHDWTGLAAHVPRITPLPIGSNGRRPSVDSDFLPPLTVPGLSGPLPRFGSFATVSPGPRNFINLVNSTSTPTAHTSITAPAPAAPSMRVPTSMTTRYEGLDKWLRCQASVLEVPGSNPAMTWLKITSLLSLPYRR